MAMVDILLRKTRTRALALFFAVCLSVGPSTASGADAILEELPRSFSEIHDKSWQVFAERFVHRDGSVRPQPDHVSTEAVSYAMLMAVCADDKHKFDRIWKWTDKHLFNIGENGYGPFAWKWGKLPDGGEGVIDRSSATDADQDIALALLMAREKWNVSSYGEAAKRVLDKLWQNDVTEIAGKRYVTAGDWTRGQRLVKLNPSYFAPYAYRVFADFDRDHDWLSLCDTSYDVLTKCLDQNPKGLPPDWCLIDRETGQVTIDGAAESAKFGFDALRVPFRLALDARENANPDALRLLARMPFADIWKKYGAIKIGQMPLGDNTGTRELRATYGAVLPALGYNSPEIAREIFMAKLLPYYRQGRWAEEEAYYASAWATLGCAAFADIFKLPSIERRSGQAR